MDKKITIPAGIALMVVLAVAGMLAIFSYTAATPVEAAVVEGTFTVTGPDATETGDVTVTFTTDADIAAATNIVVGFPADVSVPAAFGVAADPAATPPVVAVGSVTFGSTGGETPPVATVDVAVTVSNGAITVPAAAVAVDDMDPKTTGDTADDTAVVTIVIPSVTAPAAAGDVSVSLTVGGLTPVTATYVADYDVVFDTIPNKPNKNDEIIVKFRAPAGGISPGDYITIILHEDFDVPENIANTDVTIDGNVRTIDTNNVMRDVADAHPESVTVGDETIFSPSDNDKKDWLIQLKVGDMAAGDAFPGQQSIDGGETVTVTIAKVVGIKAPSEADTYDLALALVFEPKSTDVIFKDSVTTNRLVTLSSPDGSRGDEIVATAKGWPGEKIDFWRDANADSIRQSSEKVLCDQVQLTDNVAECTFNLDSTFAAGHGDPNDASSNCDGTANPKDGNNNGNCNLVNAVDSENKYALIDGEDDVIELKASVSLSPAEGNPGDSITVQIRDFPNGGTSVDRIEIAGGNDACDSNISSPPPSCNRSLNDRGDADVDIEIPNVDPGTRQLTVHVGTENEDADIVIGGGSIIATPTTVIPNQDVTLVGSGFGTGNNVRITDITLGSDTILLWPMGQNEPYIGDNPNEFDAEDLKVDSGGSWSLSVYVPVTQDTADAGSDGSSRTLTVTDSQGRSGTTNLTFAQRTVTISPEEGRRSSTISLSGENFPGLNKDGLDNLDVTIFYDGKEEESVEPDVNGRWQTTIEVPRDATIPSTNVIRVEFGADFTEIDTYRHRVPRASVTISPASGPEGSMVSLEGTGFGRFESLDELTVGGNDVTVSPNPSTDRDGNATFTFQIPGLDAGTQNVVVDFDGVTASVAFTVAEASGVVGAITSDVEVALEPLLTAGTLDRVFYFNNESKEWQWHIVDADFASTNNLDDVVSGAPLWVLVTEDTSATLNGRVVNFTCAGDDCWNLVTFP